MDPKVTDIKLVGAAWRNGCRHPGYALVSLDNGQTVFVPEENASFDGALDFVEHRADTKEMRRRLDEWVRTGRTPPPGIPGADEGDL